MFVRLILEKGLTHAEAWRQAFGHPGSRQAADRAKETMASATVQALLSSARAAATRKTVLSLSDRLAIAAGIAQDVTVRPSERLQGIKVYNETAGDHAPPPAPPAQEVIVKGDPDAPLFNVEIPRRDARGMISAIRDALARRKREEEIEAASYAGSGATGA